jgi:penicillin-binding protein 2
VAAAALEEGVITPQKTIMSVGGFKVGSWFFKDWKAGGHGPTNLLKAMAWSVNTYFYYIGGGYGDFVGLGLERLTQYFSKFNLGKETGIDLPGENSGFVPTEKWKKETKGEPWYIGDTYNLSIGQGDLLVTPLQVAVWTAAIANSGNVVHPYIGAKLKSTVEGQNISLIPSLKAKEIISGNTAYWVRQAARECVLTGSCYMLRNLPFTSGGKTGTAQWSSTKDTHGWFTAFAPFDNPQIVVSVLVEEGGEGAYVSMPVTRDFLVWWSKKYLGY